MDKETPFETGINWYDFWVKQSREFHASAEKNLKDFFDKGSFTHPEDHLKQIDAWLETLKQHWDSAQLNTEQKVYGAYWQALNDMYKEASNMMRDQWLARARNNDPIKNVRELYELWLNCCHDVYQNAMKTKNFQDMYAEFMNASLKFWKSVMPK
jgi:hypothetical protein